MARKTKEIVIESGRDEGKTFKLTELDAESAEKLFFKAVNIITGALGKSGGTPVVDLKAAALAAAGNMDIDAIRELTDVLLDKCVVYIDAEGRPQKVNKAGIEDVTTRVKLRWEAAALHIDFLQEDDNFRELFSTLTEMGKNFLNIPMSAPE